MIARSVLNETGDLLRIEKPVRRDAELAAAVSVLEKLAISLKSQALLDAESELLLMNMSLDVNWEDAKC
jgi:hypothetical protein